MIEHYKKFAASIGEPKLIEEQKRQAFITEGNDKNFQIYSGDPKDMVPFLGVSKTEKGTVLLHIPAGPKLEVDQAFIGQLIGCLTRLFYEMGK